MATTNDNSILHVPSLELKSYVNGRRVYPCWMRAAVRLFPTTMEELRNRKYGLLHTRTKLLDIPLRAMAARGWFDGKPAPIVAPATWGPVQYAPPLPFPGAASTKMYQWWAASRWSRTACARAVLVLILALYLGWSVRVFEPYLASEATCLLFSSFGPERITCIEAYARGVQYQCGFPDESPQYGDVPGRDRYEICNPPIEYMFTPPYVIAFWLFTAWVLAKPMYSESKEPIPDQVTPALRSRVRSARMLPPVPILSHHSHPKAAAARNALDDTINLLISSWGYDPYAIQLSARDVAAGIAGTLVHLWPCDRHATERSDPLLPTHAIKMMNVDYYTDLYSYLWLQQPIVLGTFTPIQPAGSEHETTWTTRMFDPGYPIGDDCIYMRVTGGGEYSHKLWDYDVDHIEAYYPGHCVTYCVESVPHSENWSVVTLIPKMVTAYDGPRRDMTLQRRRSIKSYPSLGTAHTPIQVTAAVYERSGTGDLHIAELGAPTSIRVSARLRSMIAARHSTKPLALHDLLNFMRDEYTDDNYAQSLLWRLCPASPLAQYQPVSSYQLADRRIAYRRLAKPGLVLREKLPGVVLCPPILDAAYMPVASRPNDLWCIEKRIAAVHNPQTELTAKYAKYATEFGKLIIPVPQRAFPKSVTEVIESQTRPTQRINNARASPNLAAYSASLSPATEVKSIQKKEAYPSPKDPRNISTLPTEHCLLYSCYTQPMTEQVKTFPWYGFKHPDRVAERIHYLAQRHSIFTESDFSRFDGTHSEALYEAELMWLSRFYHPSVHPQLHALHKAMREAKARTLYGVSYEIGGSRVSGASDTSLGNTLDNAFVAYCTFREMGMSEREAFDALGIYGGDDGVTPDADEAMYNRVATDFGLVMKAIARRTTDRVTFLARIYPNARASPNNCADVVRQLGKANVHPSRATTNPADYWAILYNKALGYKYTDPHTPVLADWCDYMLRNCPAASRVAEPAFLHYDLATWGTTRSYALDRTAGYAVVCADLQMAHADVLSYCLYLLTNPPLAQMRTVRDVPRLVAPDVVVGEQAGPLTPVVQVAPAFTGFTDGCPGRRPDCEGACEHRPAPPREYKEPSTNLDRAYMRTHPETAATFVSHFTRLAPTSIIDCTAYTGGDANRLAVIAPVTACEIDRSTYDVMAPLAAPRVTPLCVDGIVHAQGHVHDVAYIDPPWLHGQAYRDNPDQVPVISGMTVIQAAGMLLAAGTRVVVMKLPVTFDFDALDRDCKRLNREYTVECVARRDGRTSYLLVDLKPRAEVATIVPSGRVPTHRARSASSSTKTRRNPTPKDSGRGLGKSLMRHRKPKG